MSDLTKARILGQWPSESPTLSLSGEVSLESFLAPSSLLSPSTCPLTSQPLLHLCPSRRSHPIPSSQPLFVSLGT